MLGNGPVEGDETAAAESSADSNDAVRAHAGNVGVSGEPAVSGSGGSDESDAVQGEPARSGSEPVADNGDDSPAAVESDESKNSPAESKVTSSGRDIETIVRDVLTRTYSRYWLTDDNETVEQVVAILNDPALVNHPRFEAASKVRTVLWKNTSLAGPSAVAACNVFFAVGRDAELGPIAREAAHFAEGIIS